MTVEAPVVVLGPCGHSVPVEVMREIADART